MVYLLCKQVYRAIHFCASAQKEQMLFGPKIQMLFAPKAQMLLAISQFVHTLSGRIGNVPGSNPARLATLPHGLDSNITQLLANLLTKPCVFYYLPIVSCNLLSIKLLLLLFYYTLDL